MEESTIGLIFGLILGILIGFILTPMLQGNSIEELGQAICEQEYGLDYRYYDGGVLKCKEGPETIKYDGLEVEIHTE